MNTIVLVTGTRHPSGRITQLVEDALEQYDKADMAVMHGNARGADSACREWAANNQVQEISLPAPWGRGKRAGHERNQAMVDVLVAMAAAGYEVCAEAFPIEGSRGTIDCINRLRKAGIQVNIHEAP